MIGIEGMERQLKKRIESNKNKTKNHKINRNNNSYNNNIKCQ